MGKKRPKSLLLETVVMERLQTLREIADRFSSECDELEYTEDDDDGDTLFSARYVAKWILDSILEAAAWHIAADQRRAGRVPTEGTIQGEMRALLVGRAVKPSAALACIDCARGAAATFITLEQCDLDSDGVMKARDALIAECFSALDTLTDVAEGRDHPKYDPSGCVSAAFWKEWERDEPS